MTKQGRHRGVYLDVTEQIIDNATQRDSAHCVIADAIRATIPEATRISVDLQTIRFTDTTNSRRYIWLTPPAAQMAILGFDQGIRPKAGRIRLGQPIQTVRAGHTHLHDPKVADVTVRTETTTRSPEAHITIEGGKPIGQGALSSSPRRGRKRVFGLRQLTP